MSGPAPLQSRAHSGRAQSSALFVGMGAAIIGVMFGAVAMYLGIREAPPSAVEAAAGDGTASDPSANDSGPNGGVTGAAATKQPSALVAAVRLTRDSVVNLETPRGLGAGVIVDRSGVVLTNYHVIADALAPTPRLFGPDESGAARLMARFANERRMEAEVVIADPEEDLAVLRLLPGDDPDGGAAELFTPAAVGASQQLQVGEEVFAVGNPFGLPHTVSRGIVSALDRTDVLENSAASLIQLDASINLGNSGGPLFNLEGELVGIVTARRRQAQGIAFALPIDHVSGFLRAMADDQATRSGMIGVRLSPTTPLSPGARAAGYAAGLLIEAVEQDKSGSEAGLRKGDTIVALRGKRLDGLESSDEPEALAAHLQATVRAMFSGETLPMTVVRADDVVEVDVEVGSADAREQVLIDAEEMLGLRLDVASETPKIASIAADSPLRRYATILENAELVRVMGRPVGDLASFGATLVELRKSAARRTRQPRVRLGFRDASGQEGDILIELQLR